VYEGITGVRQGPNGLRKEENGCMKELEREERR
jgi:hypothetical protein